MESVKRISLAEEFKRNPELKEDDLQHLRDWVKKQPHFPKYTDENGLVFCLHSNYYRVEPAKVTMDNYLTSRTHMPEFFAKRDPVKSVELRKMMDVAAIVPLEGRSPEGYLVIYSCLTNLEPDRFSFNDGLRLYNMITELYMMRIGTLPGLQIVIDIRGVQMAHALRISPVAIKKYLFYLQEAVPIRIKGIHILNTSPVMDFILGIIRPFLKKELMGMLYLHPNLDSLAKFVPAEVLPNEVGGKAGPLAKLYAEVLKELEENREYFNEEEIVMRIDESRRPGKPKTAGEMFGVEGSFKKLDID